MKDKIILLICGLLLLISSCGHDNNSDNLQTKEGMIKVTILYPNDEEKTFDMDYYSNEHMPMLKNLFGRSLKKLEIDNGVSGRTPNDTAPFSAVGYLYFETLTDYQNAFKPNATKIRDDIKNYTNIQPIVQISEVIQ